MTLSRQEQDFQKLMWVLTWVFGAAGIVFFFFHHEIIIGLDAVGRWFGSHQSLKPQIPGGGPVSNAVPSRFWMVLVLSLMLTLALLCYAVYRNPKKHHYLIIPVLVSKAFSTLGFLGAIIFGRMTFGYGLGALVDGSILILILVYYGRTDLDEELMAAMQEQVGQPVIPLWKRQPDSSEPTSAAKTDPA